MSLAAPLVDRTVSIILTPHDRPNLFHGTMMPLAHGFVTLPFGGFKIG